jgi:translation initiation factor 2B subunit (eIF-2B alpha/beta/delta family)
MLPPSVEDSIRSIAEDRASGATKLARVSLETMMLLVMERQGRPSAEDLAETARKISDAQPAMAIVHNVSQLMARLMQEGSDPREVQTQIQSELDTAREHIGGTFLKVAPDHVVAVTLSDSENVAECLRRLDERGQLDRVIVMESRPLLEGRTFAKTLRETGIQVTLVVDAAGPGCMAEATVALVGADSVLRDGSVVNKVGSYPLAIAARAHKKPFFVACETLKFDARFTAATWPTPPVRDPAEVWDRPALGVDVRNPSFEIVPFGLVTRVLTERGGYAPEILQAMLSDARVTQR